ncbi:MAG: FAD-dependent oxidoreductase [Spirochaetes bacterium]|nr:FAD-dependent oxidoreductase [Spirochaetota bacterium]
MPNPIKIKAQVVSIQTFGEGTYMIRFRTAGVPPRFQAGQFLHLAIDEYDPAGGFWPESRVFSIASAPGAPELEIVYSVKGQYTRRMEKQLAVGREVWLKLPYGTFIIDASRSTDQDVVLIAGGTGISPYLPYLMILLHEGAATRKLRLYYGVRENAMLLARDLIEGCAKAGILKANLFIENEAPNRLMPNSACREQGRLNIGRIIAESTGLNDPVFYISGPPAMILTFKTTLIESGIDTDHIKIDEWE